MGNLALSNPETYNFAGMVDVQVMLQGGEPWFVAKDIAEALDVGDTYDMTRALDADEKLNRTLSGSGQSRNTTLINESGLYSCILRSRKPEAKVFKKWITSEVLPSIRKTGGYSAEHYFAPPAPPVSIEVEIAEAAARMLRMSDTSKLRMLGEIAESKGADPQFLPSYVQEDLTKALGPLLKEHGCGLSARAANLILIDLGIIEELERPTNTKGRSATFKSLTEYGLKFGRNDTATQSQNETHPRYYVSKFPELLAIIESHHDA